MLHEIREIEIEQGTKEWHELRKTHYKTASRAPVVLGLSPFQKVDGLLKELALGIEPYYNAAMKRGNELEPLIRSRAETELGEPFSPKVFTRGDYLASLDGINFDGDTVIELKASKKTFEAIMGGDIPQHYEAQIQQQIYVSGAKRGFLVAYDEEREALAISDEILPRAEFIAELDKAWADFDELLKGFAPPEQIERDDAEWLEYAKELTEVSKARKALEEQEKALKDELLRLSAGHKTSGGGVIVFPTTRKTTDYKKLIADHKIDTAPYQSESTSWTVKAG